MEAINVHTLYVCMDHNLYGSSLFLRDTECIELHQTDILLSIITEVVSASPYDPVCSIVVKEKTFDKVDL
jgi:hypothetical protein